MRFEEMEEGSRRMQGLADLGPRGSMRCDNIPVTYTSL